MDCKCESTVKTFLRIEVLILQGLLDAVFLFFIGVLLVPFSPFIYAVVRWRVERKRLRWLTKVLCLPMWLLSGLLMGLLNPIGVFGKAISDIVPVVKVEWTTRWMTGQPKKPNGHPLTIKSEAEKEMLDAAVTMSVVNDYNEEAKAYGQGIDFGDEDE